MINYDSVIDQLQSAGLVINGGIVADGVVRRVRTTEDKEKRGWYCLHEWQSQRGNRYLVGTYGVWHGNDNGAQKIELGKDQEISKEEQAALRKRIAEDKKRAKAQRQARQKRAARHAEAAWSELLTAPPAGAVVDYLERKEIEPHGVRYTKNGSIALPMLGTDDRVHGLQFILPSHHPRKKKTGRDKEYWPAGLAKQGHFFPIGMVSDGAVCLVAEGFATGATLNEATALPCVVAFDANNLKPVCVALKKRYPKIRLLVCADDDYIQRCKACGERTRIDSPTCEYCGQPHDAVNPGIAAASLAALEVGGAWVAPVFPADREGKKLTDFNDLRLFPQGGDHLVRQTIRDKLEALKWDITPRGGVPPIKGSGDGGEMVARITPEEGVRRYWGTYGMGGDVLFDEVERRLVHKKDVQNLLPRHGWDEMRSHGLWRVARDTEIGFDPTESDPAIRCNLFGGWPTEPKPGKCDALLGLLEYLCSNEDNYQEVYQYLLFWLAYPLQNRGAKMHTAPVIHGPQGTGKSRFFEAYGAIYGEYGRVLGQEALEDKFNADWAEKKLFILADEVLARQDMYHVKNRLKGFITGDTIRVNPKNIAAHTEKNQMNIVFLSNEHMPLVLENDDRRHVVIWVPPKLDDGYFAMVNEEIENGGIAALHHYLLNLDLGDFKPWTKPPMTRAKMELIDRAASSEERFVRDWMALELENAEGDTLPLCPANGSTLYHVYERWCRAHGEIRPRPANQFIGYINKLHGWSAGKVERTLANLAEGAKPKMRRMVVPSDEAMSNALKLAPEDSDQPTHAQRAGEPKYKWLTRGYFAFEKAVNAGAGGDF